MGHKVGHIHVNALIRIVKFTSFFHFEDIGVWHPNCFKIPGEMIPPMQKEDVLYIDLIDICDHPSDVQNEPIANELEEEWQTRLLIKIPVPFLKIKGD